MSLGCPYVAGPECPNCGGACWEPAAPVQQQPEPCQWCSELNGTMQQHDGTCDVALLGATSGDEYKAARRAWHARRTYGGTS